MYKDKELEIPLLNDLFEKYENETKFQKLFENSFGQDEYHFDPDCGIHELVKFYVFHCLNPDIESELSIALKNHSKILSFDYEKDVFYDKENDNYFTIWKMSLDSPLNIEDYINFCNKVYIQLGLKNNK